MKTTILECDKHSTLPYDLRLSIAERIQRERPYSPCQPAELVEQMFECTRDGCISVLLYTDDDELIGGGEIILVSGDFHVGDCFTYLWSWVHPDYRHGEATRLLVLYLRECTRISDATDWYMITRQVSPRVFKTTYKQVNK